MYNLTDVGFGPSRTVLTSTALKIVKVIIFLKDKKKKGKQNIYL